MSTPFYLNVTENGVPTDGSSDCSPSVQALVDAINGTAPGEAMSRTLAFPAGTYIFHKPIVNRGPSIAIMGCPSGGTWFRPIFGGPCIVSQKPRALPPVLTSLATGDGNAYQLGDDTPGHALPGLLLDSVVGLGNLANLNGGNPADLEINFFYDPVDADYENGVGMGCILSCSMDYGVKRHRALALWDQFPTSGRPGAIKVEWDWEYGSPNVFYSSDHAVDPEEGPYYVRFKHLGTASPPRIELWVGKLGEAAVRVLNQEVSNTTFPQHGGGVEPFLIGYLCRGLLNGEPGWAARPSSIDGFEVLVGGHSGGFTCPTAKPTVTTNTIFLTNFELEDPFVVGYIGTTFSINGDRGFNNSYTNYVLPLGTPETQMGSVLIRDIFFLGQEAGPSAIRTCDNIDSETAHIRFEQVWQGVVHDGTHFASRAYRHGGVVGCVSWMDRGPANDQLVQALTTTAGGIAIVSSGFGGVFEMIYPSPTANSFATVYFENSVGATMIGVGVDDEGQAGGAHHVFVVNGCGLNLIGGQLGRSSSDGPVFSLANGGFVNIFGSGLSAVGGTEIINFSQQPLVTPVVFGCFVSDWGVRTVTTKPQWCIFEQGGVFHSPDYDFR